MRKDLLLIIIIFCAGTFRVSATEVCPMPADSTVLTELKEYVRDTVLSVEDKNRIFYENLEAKAQNSRFAKWIHSMLITPPKKGEEQKEVVDESLIYRPYEGMTISEVQITTKPIFDRARSVLQKAMQATHKKSWKYTVRRDLMFSAGDRIDADLLVRNKQILSSRKYLNRAEITVEPDPEDTTSVIVKVVTKDNWTIVPGGSVAGLSGRVRGDIMDYNVIGSGNRLKYSLSLDWKKGRYRGSLLEYNIPNIMGSFYRGDFIAGKTFTRERYSAAVNKEFISGNDYEIGAYFNWEKNDFYMLPYDSTFTMRSFIEWDFWAGRSMTIPGTESNIYAMARYYNVNNANRPDVAATLNPYFHDQQMLLGALGVYHEKFLTSNLVYGYGITEYIATGYRAEFNGGYSWDEFGQGCYLGLGAKAGGFVKLGYLMGDVRFGGYLDYGGKKLYRSALNVKVDYFTHLLKAGRNQMRQFVSVNYVWGINRADGVSEFIKFTKDNGPRYFRDYAVGRNRLVVNTESVIFTPWNPVDFRVTIFGFADAGWLGNNPNVFKNDFYTSLGAGIRLKNEMLVFSSIELSLSVALGPGGFKKNYPVMLDNRSRARFPRFNPVKPQMVEYQ